jgi:hypothetical protein
LSSYNAKSICFEKKNPIPEIESKESWDFKSRENIKYSSPVSSFKGKKQNLERLGDLPKVT